MSDYSLVIAALASWRGDKRFPATAKAGKLDYNVDRLYDSLRDDWIARPIGKGKRRAVLVIDGAGARYGSWGRRSESIAGTVTRHHSDVLDGVLIVVSGLGHNAAYRGNLHAIACALAGANQVAEAIAICRAINKPVSSLPKPTLQSSGRYRSSPSSMAVDMALETVDPAARKAANAKRAKEARYNAAIIAWRAIIAKARNSDPDYQAAYAMHHARDRVGPDSIARYLGLPVHTLIKFVQYDGCGSHQSRYQYSEAVLRGAEATPYTSPAICRSGYHFTEITHWHSWCGSSSNAVYIIEPVNGIADSATDKHVAGSIWFKRRLGTVSGIESGAIAMLTSDQANAQWKRYADTPVDAMNAITRQYIEFGPAEPTRAQFGLEG
jgi:hypothetical protein